MFWSPFAAGQSDIPAHYGVASVRVTAEGYEARTVSTSGSTWVERRADPIYVASWEMDLGTIVLKRKET